MKNKHEQLYVAVQDLLIELGITPERLKGIATGETHGPMITPKTAQKLIDADLIAEEVNWRKPGNVFGSRQESVETESKTGINDSISKDAVLLTFNKIKSSIPRIVLWEYLRKEHPEFLFEQMKDYLFPSD